MKFMQRAAAASPTSPGVSQSDSERPSKRAKTESRSALGTPQNQSPSFDQKATQAALDAEDRRRAALIEQQAERLGDAHWKLDPAKLPGSDQRKGAPLKIVQIGFSQIDRRDALETNQGEADGPSFHSYGPKKTKKTKASKDDVRVSPIQLGEIIKLTYFYRMIILSAQTAILTLTLIHQTLLVKVLVRKRLPTNLVVPVMVHKSVKNYTLRKVLNMKRRRSLLKSDGERRSSLTR